MTCGVADINAFARRKMLVKSLTVLNDRENRIFQARRLVESHQHVMNLRSTFVSRESVSARLIWGLRESA